MCDFDVCNKQIEVPIGDPDQQHPERRKQSETCSDGETGICVSVYNRTDLVSEAIPKSSGAD